MTTRTINSLSAAVSKFIAANNDSIFVVTASIDFSNQTLTMPAHSLIVFEGNGRLYGGTFVGHKVINDYVDVRWFASQDSGENGPNGQSLAIAMALSDNVFISGTVELSATFTINRSGVRLYGRSPHDASICLPTGMSYVLKIAQQQSFITIENLTVSGFQLDNSSTDDIRRSVYCHMICADGYNSNILIKGCVFDSGTSGVYVMPNCQFLTIEGCTFRNMVFIPNQRAGSYGVVFQRTGDGRGSDHVIIRDCIFEKTVVRHAFYIQACNDVLITNNIVYGTTEYNDSLIDKYYAYANNPILYPALSDVEVASFDITKHMTRYDSAISFHGCTNVRFINNYFENGIIVLNGVTAPTGVAGVTVKGKFYLLRDNVVKGFRIPHYNNHPSLYNWDSIDDYRMIDNVEIDNVIVP